ncbi:uncharacterized protein MELLADRAFT_111441 [Melampsora larici-populina 98AG31]|uniref:Uncharacterized protein n=1 Tax=Melampsora larici-populina (strain 98AG31 / pathotype 3-4-7) TaxID=747676 RepID=F4S375_MELLP|nr:uncharacterized protein MELLADRAFT_111441 [Melampsora larici-populina 98AG31]EGG00932.1 hypothetical protein MELLADRAFT_111441 [Melampsora larici-populina 98AG31]
MTLVRNKHGQVSPHGSRVANLIQEAPCENSTTQLPVNRFSNISSPVNLTDNNNIISTGALSETSSNDSFAGTHANPDTADLPSHSIDFHRFGSTTRFFVAMAIFQAKDHENQDKISQEKSPGSTPYNDKVSVIG